MTKIINVTQEDINKGKRRSCISCPIALALKREFPGRSITVDDDSIGIGIDVYSLSKEIITFINQFDGELYVKPFSFDFDSLTKVD